MGATQGKNDYSDVAYGGPRPPSGEDRYFFKAYALDTVLPLSRGSQRGDLEREMKDHVIDSATLRANTRADSRSRLIFRHVVFAL